MQFFFLQCKQNTERICKREVLGGKMFNGVADQFHDHQFMASSTTSRTSINLHVPLSLSHDLHNLASSNVFNSFDPLFNSKSHDDDDHHQVPLQLHQFVHPVQQHQKHHRRRHHHQRQPAAGQKSNEEKEDNDSLVAMNMEVERQRSMAETFDPWSDDEVLALLRITCSMENWFPQFTWEHVSRKLAELGFKRNAENCKGKFEEESRYFSSISCSSKDYRIFSELEELCQGHDHNHDNSQQVKKKNVEKSREDEDLEDGSRNIDHHENYQTSVGKNGSEHDNEKLVNNGTNSSSRKKIGKKQKKFEMIKGFCEEIVNKLMNQQEEKQNKLIEDMVKRYEETVARDEAWKKQELDRINQELELTAKEQAVAGDRQATIIKLLSKFSSPTGSSKKQRFGRFNNGDLVKVLQNEHSDPSITSSSLVTVAQNPNPIFNTQDTVDQVSAITMILDHQNSGYCPSPTQNNLQNPNPKNPISSSALSMASQNPNSVNAESSPLPLASPLIINQATQNPTSNDKEDRGKRWRRDEVLALINLRCSLYNNGGDHEEAFMKAPPLWERISQGMLELGYRRSSKRCKEKWENINKYFRKTKHVNKKRSLDSRTCPYFHQLNTLYNQGTPIAPSQPPENHSTLPENHSRLLETGNDSSQRRANKDYSSTVHVSEGETNMVQIPAFEFEF